MIRSNNSHAFRVDFLSRSSLSRAACSCNLVISWFCLRFSVKKLTCVFVCISLQTEWLVVAISCWTHLASLGALRDREVFVVSSLAFEASEGSGFLQMMKMTEMKQTETGSIESLRLFLVNPEPR